MTSNYAIYSIVIVAGDTVEQEEDPMQNINMIEVREPTIEMTDGFRRMKDVYGEPTKIKRQETVPFLYESCHYTSSSEYKYYTNIVGRYSGTKPIPINNK